VEVIEYDTGKAVKALIYRGTPANPAFWERALLDLPMAAAVMSVAIGPSGRNDDYLFNLDKFMSDPNVATPFGNEFHGDTDTSLLAAMAKRLQRHRLHFLSGCGSNQHNQLLLKSDSNNACLANNGEDAPTMKEIVLCTDGSSDANIKCIDAGGGHTALLTESGDLFLWGWNDHGQLGRTELDHQPCVPFPIIPKLNILVEEVALGFSHTLVIEKATGSLHAFGSNSRRQVGACDDRCMTELPIALYPGTRFIDIAAGLFHSAAITNDGCLITFGCNRFGQAPPSPWKPPDGSALVRVACGRRHTIAVDERGRVWTMGDNKYGQLGRSTSRTTCQSAQLVDGILGEEGSGFLDIKCGWSHCVVSTNKQRGSIKLFGWGRNDKGQLGLGVVGDVSTPTLLANEVSSISSFSCGAESTVLVDEGGRLYGCGWNEHGNLGTGDESDSLTLRLATGARIVTCPLLDGIGENIVAAGGAHVIAARKRHRAIDG
jgi:alpha-tubulin suppressor-like RCC1 family protein